MNVDKFNQISSMVIGVDADGNPNAHVEIKLIKARHNDQADAQDEIVVSEVVEVDGVDHHNTSVAIYIKRSDGENKLLDKYENVLTWLNRENTFDDFTQDDFAQIEVADNLTMECGIILKIDKCVLCEDTIVFFGSTSNVLMFGQVANEPKRIDVAQGIDALFWSEPLWLYQQQFNGDIFMPQKFMFSVSLQRYLNGKLRAEAKYDTKKLDMNGNVVDNGCREFSIRFNKDHVSDYLAFKKIFQYYNDDIRDGLDVSLKLLITSSFKNNLLVFDVVDVKVNDKEYMLTFQTSGDENAIAFDIRKNK